MWWEILKASKGLLVDDPVAALWGRNISSGKWPVTALTGELPLTFLSQGGALNGYRIYGTSEGAGAETGNLLNMTDLINAPSGEINGLIMDAVLTLTLAPNTAYTLLSTGFGSSKAADDADIYRSVYFNGTTRSAVVFLNRPVSSISDGNGAIKIGFLKTRTNAQQYLDGSAYLCLLEGDHTSTQSDTVPYGYKLPLAIESGEQSQDIPVYIGDTKLGEEEYVDYQSGKIYREPVIAEWEYVIQTVEKAEDPDGRYVRYTFARTVSDDVEISAIGYAYVNRTTGELTLDTEGVNSKEAATARKTGLVRIAVKDEGKGTAAVGYVVLQDGTYVYSDVCSYDYAYVKSHEPLSASGVSLTPTDPPVPLPPIPTYKGENTLSSTETLSEVTVKGRIKEVDN